MKYTKTAFSAVPLLLASALMLSGCGTSGVTTEDLQDDVSATATATSTPEATETVTPSASPVNAEERFVTTEKDGVTYTNDIPLKGTSKNDKGTYAQTTVKQDAPYMTFSLEDSSDAVKKAVKNKKITEKELAELQKKMMVFIAEESLDSPLNGGKDTAGWLKQNADFIHPEFVDQVKKDLAAKDGGTFLVRGVDDGYTYYYDPSHGRLTSRDIELSQVDFVEAEGYDAVVFVVDFSMAMPSKNDKDDVITELTSGSLTYSLVKHDGKWKLAPWQNSYQIKEMKAS